MNTNKELKDALDFDPIAEAERMVGISYKEDDAVTWLGMGLQQLHRQKADALLFLNRDTNSWNQNLQEWIEVVEGMGFELVAFGEIPDSNDKWRIWWMKGILLFSDSYHDDTQVNGANAWLNYKGPREAMHQCSNGFAMEIDGVPVWTVQRDAREGLRFALQEMGQSGEVLSKWVKRPFMWLLHYNDTKTEGYDHKAITESRIQLLPPHVQEAISPNT